MCCQHNDDNDDNDRQSGREQSNRTDILTIKVTSAVMIVTPLGFHLSSTPGTDLLPCNRQKIRPTLRPRPCLPTHIDLAPFRPATRRQTLILRGEPALEICGALLRRSLFCVSRFGRFHLWPSTLSHSSVGCAHIADGTLELRCDVECDDWGRDPLVVMAVWRDPKY